MARPSRESITMRIAVVGGALLLTILGIYLLGQQPTLRVARLLQCLLVFGLAVTLAWALRGVWRNIALVCCSLLFGLAAIESVMIATSKRSSVQAGGFIHEDSGLSQPRPLVGWGPIKPGVYHWKKTTADGKTIYDTHVTIDETLNRKTEPPTGPHSIAFFGDSWIFGDGVEDDATLPQAFSDLLGRKIPVLNLSYAGWNPATNLIALQSGLYKSLLDSPRHFFLFTSPFHLERVACKNRYSESGGPRYVPDGSTVKYVGPCSGSLGVLAALHRIARGFTLFNRVEPMLARPTHQDVEIYLKVIEAFVATAKKTYGVPTTVLFTSFDGAFLKGSGYTEGSIVKALRTAGVDVLVDKLPDDPALYEIPNDGHPNKLANQEKAKQIKAHLEKVDPAALRIGAD